MSMIETSTIGVTAVMDTAAPAEFDPLLPAPKTTGDITPHQQKVRMKRCVSRFHEGDRSVPFEDFGDHPSSRDGKQSNCKKCRNHYHKLRRQNDPKFYLTHHIATRVRQQVGAEGYVSGFTKHIDDYLGYRMLDLVRALNEDCHQRYKITLKEAIKRGFHLDHRYPLSKYNVQSIESPEFKACWAMDNLWMLPAEVNLAKSDQVLSGDDLLKLTLSTPGSAPEKAPKPAPKQPDLIVDFTPKHTQNPAESAQMAPSWRETFWSKAFD